LNLLAAIALVLMAFVFESMGLAFFSFLCLVAAVLATLAQLASGKTEAKSQVYEQGGAVVVENKGPEIPPLIKVKIKRNWKDNEEYEDQFAAMGETLDTMGRSVARLFFGKKKKEKTA